MAEMGVHRLTSGPIAFDFARQSAFVANPDLEISDVAVLTAHDENGEDVSGETFDPVDYPHQIDGLVVRVWVRTPPAGRLRLTCAVTTLANGVAGVEVWQDQDYALPLLVVNGEGASPVGGP